MRRSTSTSTTVLVALAIGPLAWSSVASAADAPPAARTLPNGIVLPEVWPPPTTDVPDEPQRPPYLAAPPAVIPIDVGRQLFVDDFLIAETTLSRTFKALPRASRW